MKEVPEKDSEAVKVTLGRRSIEEETAEQTSVSKASIMLMLLWWEEPADLISRCGAGSLGRADQRSAREESDRVKIYISIQVLSWSFS